MRWRYLFGYAVLIAIVMWGCSGCSDRERKNCVRAGNQPVTISSDLQVGTGRCA
jgi:fructose/tagatose bisphosphate aldolase